MNERPLNERDQNRPQDPLEEALRRERLQAEAGQDNTLDEATPRADLWSGIAAQLDADAAVDPSGNTASASGEDPALGQEAQSSETIVRQLKPAAPAWQGWLRVAAVLAAVLAAGLWLSQQSPNQGPASGSSGSTLASERSADLPPIPEGAERDPRFVELQSVATQYARLADRSEDRILENPALGPEESEIAVAFLADLENDYRGLLDDWAEGADPDKVLKAMVRNYRQRIELLEHLSNILEPQSAPQNDTRYEDAVVL